MQNKVMLTRELAVRLFSDSSGQHGIRNLAAALGIYTQAIYQWPEVLNRRQTNEIMGALQRHNLIWKLTGEEEPENVDDIYDRLRDEYREFLASKGNGKDREHR